MTNPGLIAQQTAAAILRDIAANPDRATAWDEASASVEPPLVEEADEAALERREEAHLAAVWGWLP